MARVRRWAALVGALVNTPCATSHTARRLGVTRLARDPTRAAPVASGSEPAASAFDAQRYPGYTATPDPQSGVGGWLAHRGRADEPGSGPGDDWVLRVLEDLDGARAFAPPPGSPAHKPRILVLFGSLREPRAFSKELAFEFARLLEALGCDVRTYDPHQLPMRDPALEAHPKVAELRALSEWSEGQVWVSPEMHGTLTAAFKNQIDWLPLNTGSVRPTQGRTVCVAQVCGGSQSFNVVNALRLLARWMRMPCCTNQSSVPKAWQEFDADGRMKPSDLRDRVVDVAEEFYKFTLLMRGATACALNDRYSERKERAREGQLLTQAQKEARGAAEQAARS